MVSVAGVSEGTRDLVSYAADNMKEFALWSGRKIEVGFKDYFVPFFQAVIATLRTGFGVAGVVGTFGAGCAYKAYHSQGWHAAGWAALAAIALAGAGAAAVYVGPAALI